MRKRLILAALLASLMFAPSPGAEARRLHPDKARIVFVPHDNRPISSEQTADTIRKMGWEIEMPPDDILGSREDTGTPERVWEWLEENVSGADIAVLSSDTLLYGSLVGSRKHSFSDEELSSRVENFRQFKKKHPRLKLYVFGSIMRTPRSGEASGSEEPGYYQSYGSDIFRYTALVDKEDTEGLTRREKKEYAFLKKLIPKEAIGDWMSRRAKNFSASEKMIRLAREGVFDYFALGRDDNAPYSQTHMESRKLSEEGRDLAPQKFSAMAGIDEFGLLMLTRAVNNWTSSAPFVYVRYNWGRGENTVPSYSDEKISESVKAHVAAAGGLVVNSAKGADFVLLVNTNPTGRTFEGGDRKNGIKPRDGTRYFADLVQESVDSGKSVCLADIAYANGADNALMEELKNRSLLYRLRAYAGWNTATNSTGFVLSQGMLADKMTPDAMDELLTQRYLDDWAYQANVRGIVARQLGWFRASGAYSSLDEKRAGASGRATQLMRRFAEDNLPPIENLENLTVTFPWNRMFEARLTWTSPMGLKDYMNDRGRTR